MGCPRYSWLGNSMASTGSLQVCVLGWVVETLNCSPEGRVCCWWTPCFMGCVLLTRGAVVEIQILSETLFFLLFLCLLFFFDFFFSIVLIFHPILLVSRVGFVVHTVLEFVSASRFEQTADTQLLRSIVQYPRSGRGGSGSDQLSFASKANKLAFGFETVCLPCTVVYS